MPKQTTLDLNTAYQAIETIPNLLVIANAQQKIFWFNQNVTKQTGYTTKDITGIPLTSFLVGKGTDSKKIKELKSALNAGKSYKAVLLHYTKKQKPFWNEVSITPVKNSNNKTEKYIFLSTDVTERLNKTEELLYTELRWKFALEKAGDDYFEYNFETNRFFGSDNLQRLLNIKSSSSILSISSLINIVHPDDTEKAVNTLFDLLSGDTDTFQQEMRIKNKTGNFTWVNVRAAVTHRNTKGDAIHLIGTTSDISGIKETERQLAEAKAKAEELSEYRSRFLSTMSHEIRTPLNGIIGLTNLMLLENRNEAMKENLNTLSFSANHLLSLINNVLDLSKIEAGKIQFVHDTFNLRETVESVYKTFLPVAANKGIKLQNSIQNKVPEFVLGDKHRLTQMLNNLVNNAVKFTEKGKVEINIQLEKKTKQKAEIKFSVTDTGIGVSRSNQKKIFDDFVQADSATTAKYGGTGLGLAITKRLIEMQNGKLSLQSRLNKGSCFSFTLNLEVAKVANRSVKYEKETTKQLHHAKILLAEDNVVNQKVALSYLNHWQAKTDCANNGKKALSLFKKNRYDLLIVDLYMPEMNGFDTISQIRQLKSGKKIPIIALTASAEQHIMARAIDCGANICLTKPFDATQLLSEIKKLLNKSQRMAIVTKGGYQVAGKFKHINLKRLYDASLGSKTFVAEMIETIKEEVPAIINDAEVSMRKKNLPGLASSIHKLKNSLLLIGLDELAPLLKKIEAKALAGKFEPSFEIGLKTISQTWKNAKTELEKIK